MYWQKREAEYQKFLDRTDSKTVKKISKAFQNAVDVLAEEMEKALERAEMTADEVAETDLFELEDQVKRIVADKDTSEEANEFMRKFNAMAKFDRDRLFAAKLNEELVKLGAATQKTMKYALTDAAERELILNMGVMSEMEKSPQTLERLVNSSFHGATWSKRIWDDMDKLRTTLNKEFTRAFAVGTGYPVAKALQKELGVSKNNAKRLALTELTRVRIDSRLQRFKDNGVQEYKYNAIIDTRTSDVCQGLNGLVFSIDEAKAGVNLPPMHPYCRSSVLPVREQLDTAIEETPEESLKFAEEMLAKNPDSELWKGVVDYQRNRVNSKVYSLNGLRAPVRPNKDDYPDYDSYLIARNQYRAEKDKYLAYIQQQADLADSKIPHITFEEGMELLKKRGLTPDGLKDLEGNDYRVLLDLSQVYDEVMTKYPFLKKYNYKTMDGGTISTGVNYVVGAKPGDTYEAAFGNAAMYIGIDSFKSYPERVSSVLDSMGSKWYVEGDGTYKSTYRHEFGHAMDDYIQNKIRDGKESPEYSPKLEEYTNELLSLRESDGVSVYSYTTAGETFAEGFASYEGGQDTEFAKRFGDFLKKWV